MIFKPAHLLSTDLYHISCFEELADFSDASFLDIIIPVTQGSIGYRGVNMSSGNYLLDYGADRLVQEWKTAMGKYIDLRDWCC